MAAIYINYLNGLDIDALAMTDAEILDAVEAGLVAQGNGQTVIEPRVHLEPDPAFRGHFNVLRGYVAPLDMAGVKIVGDYVDNYLHGLPSEFGILNLFDPRTGMPRAILDATVITDMRTGAVTAIGAKHLAQKGSHMLGHIGVARHRLLERAAARPTVRFRRDPRAFAPAGKPRCVRRETCGRSRQAGQGDRRLAILRRRRRHRRRGVAPAEPQPLLKTEWIKPGALVVPYGTMSAVELSLTDIMGKIVVDDWGQCKGGKFGSLRAHVETGRLSERRCMPSSARSSPGQAAGARATTRRSCSGIAACR